VSVVGDRERFERLYRDAYPTVLKYCLRRLPPETARDAAAEVFTVAWRRFEVVPDPPLPWLIATASLTVRTAVRSDARRDRLSARLAVVDPPSQPPDLADGVARDSRVREALARLAPADRELLVLHAWDDLDAAAIAAVLGCSQAAVRVRLHRARRRLAAALDETTAASTGRHSTGSRAFIEEMT
jgi:RNA polymerase sigma-70 factor (ECF subfamily)